MSAALSVAPRQCSEAPCTDPLDTNADGTVSAQERAVCELTEISALVDMAMKRHGAASGSQADTASSTAISVAA